MPSTNSWRSALRPMAVTELHPALALALEELTEPPPCSIDPELWSARAQERDAEAVADVEYVAALCRRCPILDACGQHIAEYPGEVGTWAGLPEHVRGRALVALWRRAHAAHWSADRARAELGVPARVADWLTS